ncbi:MAG: extracellular solute-binding protein [Lachnospiraceae bacterium]|nr:extracellular solute-binding protein [Lachnospiraceae bacterium]
MKKRMTSLLMAGVMAMTMVSGAAAVMAEENGEVNYYGFDEPVTIKVGLSYAAASDFTFYGGETVDDNAWVDLYNANNIFLDVLYDVDPSQAETKLATAIMSGDYPDIISTTAAEYQNYVDSGVVADISEVYEKYASDDLREIMEYDGGMALGGLEVDGKIYGLPTISDPYTSVHVMFIRKDWLDNLGLEVPTTMEQLKEVAHAFTHNDPDGNGVNDTYGLAFDGVNVLNDSVGNMGAFFEGFGVYLGKTGLSYLENEDGEIVWGGANAEGMKAALTLLNEMYEDGSIARDFITMDAESIFAETGAGRAGIWFAPNWGAMNPAADAAMNDINAHVIAAAVPSGIEGQERLGYVSATPSKVYCVSSECENPEVLIKLLNLTAKYMNPEKCTAEEYNMYYGDSANYSGWKMTLCHVSIPTGRQTAAALTSAIENGDPSALNTKQLENYTSIKTYMDAVADGTYDPFDTTHQRGHSLYTVYSDPQCAWTVLNEMLANDSFVLSAYNALPSETVSNASGTLQKLLVETIVKIITGADSVDSYDSFLETWYALGGQDALDEANGK